MIEIISLQRRLEQEEYILGGIRPSSPKYQPQFQKVKDIRAQIESLEIQENSRRIKDAKK
jgi:hypothetical protein